VPAPEQLNVALGAGAAAMAGVRGRDLWARGVATLKRSRRFLGPALLVSVGYMDPGNWGTDLQAGAQYQYALLWVVALAGAMAIVLQLLAARLGIVTGKNLAQACRDWYPTWCRLPLWIFCEIAIGACDLAEVLGSAVAINLLFGTPILMAVLFTAADVLLLLILQKSGMRAIERVVVVLVLTIAGAFFIELFVLPGTSLNLHEMGAALVHPAGRRGHGEHCGRDHRRNGDAPQPVFAFGVGAAF